MYLCDWCKCEFPESCERCPHCVRPVRYPNLRAAEKKEESEALKQRYDKAVCEIETHGTVEVARAFECALGKSKAVIARPVGELQRLAQSDREIYVNHYEAVDGGFRIPAENKWDVIRVGVDEALFHGYKHHIVFAALTLNDDGVPYYGDCYIVLQNEMIAHRTTVFDNNSIKWMEERNIEITKADDLPNGYRAPWSNRGQLAIAKLGNKLEETTAPETFPTLLLQPAEPPIEEDFIEAHIWGSITIRAVEKVKVAPAKTVKAGKACAAMLEAVEETLQNAGITNVTIEV